MTNNAYTVDTTKRGIQRLELNIGYRHYIDCCGRRDGKREDMTRGYDKNKVTRGYDKNKVIHKWHV